MDRKLVAWARRVKPGTAGSARLWLFTDAARLGDPRPAIRALPRGAAGVVFRPEGWADAGAMGRSIAAICRERRLVLSVAGDWRLAAQLRAGMHLRGGRRPVAASRLVPAVTASAHDRAEAVRGRGSRLVFLSPIFATLSHPGQPALGPTRWSLLARTVANPGCLGGVSGSTIRAIPRRCMAVGAVSALC